MQALGIGRFQCYCILSEVEVATTVQQIRDGFADGPDFARDMDAQDPLISFRERFHLPDGQIYLLGNSLGLMSRDSERGVLHAMDEWRRLGIHGWLQGDPPWFHLAEQLGGMCAGLVGAEESEVVATATTSINIHSLVSTLFRPRGVRTKILADELSFPSDLYALSGQLAMKGLDPEEHLVLVKSRDGRTIEEQDVIDAMTEEIALIHLPSVLYRSGQLLDMQALAAAAREREIVIGFDCCHSVGVIPHHLDAWDVDYAMWCSYKYLNAGPGSTAFLYLNRRHFEETPMLPGWFGFHKDRQFDMLPVFEHQKSAGGWQISSPTILGAAPIEGSLRVIQEAGIRRIRDKSLGMTTYLMQLLGGLGTDRVRVGTPRDDARRGGHVAVEVAGDAQGLFGSLSDAGVVVDFRPPDVIRMAPSPLYNSFEDVHRAVQLLRRAMG